MKTQLKIVVVILAVTMWGQTPLKNARAGDDPKIPVSVQRLLIEVRTAMDKKEYAAAVKLIQADQAKAKSQAPCSHPIVCLALGNCCLMQKDLAQAESAYVTALDLDKNYLEARVNLAKVYTDSNRHEQAADAFQAAYDISEPKNADYLYYAAVMALSCGKPKTAITRFDTLFAAHPTLVTRQWQESYANALITDRQWKKAVPVVKALADQAQGEARIRWQETLLQIYLTLNDTDKALGLATVLSREAPSEARWWKALVHIRLTRGDYTNALENLIIYGFLTPLTQQEQKLFADLSLQLNLPKRAARMYEAMLADTTGDAASPDREKQVVDRLVNAYRQMGETEKALAVLNRFDPRSCNPEFLLLKGDVLYETKNYKAADEAFRAAAKNNCSKKGQAWLMAGYSAWQYNDLVASRDAFKQAAQFKRQRKDALAAIAQLKRSTRM